jgi:hypothetical protein
MDDEMAAGAGMHIPIRSFDQTDRASRLRGIFAAATELRCCARMYLVCSPHLESVGPWDPCQEPLACSFSIGDCRGLIIMPHVRMQSTAPLRRSRLSAVTEVLAASRWDRRHILDRSFLWTKNEHHWKCDAPSHPASEQK